MAMQQGHDDGFRERSIQDGGPGGDGSWVDWGGVMHTGMRPQVISFFDIFRSAMVTKNPFEHEQFELVAELTDFEITHEVAQAETRLEVIQTQYEALHQALDITVDKDDDEDLALAIADFPVGRHIPRTRNEMRERLEVLSDEAVYLQDMIDDAKEKNAYWSAYDLQKWMENPTDQVGDLMKVMSHYGKMLLRISGISQNSTYWAHIQAVISRQLAPFAGGTDEENMKTRVLPEGRHQIRTGNESE